MAADPVAFARDLLRCPSVTPAEGGALSYLADNPVRRIVAIMSAMMAEPLDSGSAHFDPSNLEFTSVDVGNKTVNVIPAEARGRFNIRFNDVRSRDAVKAEVEARANAGAGGGRFRIEWEPSNADAFVTTPGPFVELVVDTVAEVTGRPVLTTPDSAVLKLRGMLNAGRT